jgi:cytochrome c peroxidase
VALFVAGCQAPAPVATAGSAPPAADVHAFAPLPPLPGDPANPVADDERAAHLGQRLFYDTGYSRDGSTSCASCHQPARAFADGLPSAHALGQGRRNTPALGLAAYQRWQGWGGRGDSLGTQALAAMQNPLEMGMDRLAAARRLLETEGPTYQALFGAAPAYASWPATGGADYDRLPEATRKAVEGVDRNLGNALGAYIRRLVPGPSAFDRYAMGDSSALTPEAQAGFQLFAGKARCAQCHDGPTFSDGAFHNLGLPQPLSQADHGRLDDLSALKADVFRGAEDLPAPGPDDDGRFRTPTLRDVSRTAPYWHAGTFATLEEVVDFDLAGGQVVPGKHYPGTRDPKLQAVGLTAAERQALLAFLRSLEMAPVGAPWGGPPEGQGAGVPTVKSIQPLVSVLLETR